MLKRLIELGLLAGVLAAGLAGCKQDCSEESHLGDFELSQGNYINAAKHYRKALAIDPHCGNAGSKLADAELKAKAESLPK